MQISPEDARPSEDSLARQLRALQEAKNLAAQEQQRSDEQIARRQDQLRRETVRVLQTTPRLHDALQRWPSPTTPRLEVVALSEKSAASPEEELPGDSSTLPAPESPEPASSILVGTDSGMTKEAAQEGSRAHERSPQSSACRELAGSSSNGDLQVELRRCRQALRRCARAVAAAQLRQLRALRRPPPPVARTLEFISLLLGEKEGKTVNFKKLLADALPERLSSFEPQRVLSPQLRSKLQTFGLEATTYQPCHALARWCECIRVFLVRMDGEDAAYPGEEALKGDGLLVSPDLQELDEVQLRQVEDLTITKEDVASVLFHGITDCSGLDLSRDVLLKRGYVLVYPEVSRKPPPGRGLNKRATVTMYKCFPPGGPVDTPEEAEEYKQKIKKMTEENTACRFIDYDCATGVWRFEVHQF